MFRKRASSKRFIIVGDVHGCLSELKNLWSKLSISSSDKLIFLGDLVDKGPDSDGVVSFVKDKKESGFNVTLVEGNHEEKRINKYYRATPDTEYDNDNPRISSENIEFLETAIPYYRFNSGGKNFMCVHGGIYPAFKEELKDNRELDSMYTGSRKTEKAIKVLNSSLNLLKQENNTLNKIPKQERTDENRLRAKAIPSEIAVLKNDILELQNTNTVSKEIKDHINRLKRFFVTRYVDETGQVIPMDPETMKPTREGVYWTDTYDGRHGTVFYGHEPYDEVSSTDHTHGIDTGAVYGGKLTAAIVQDGEVSFVSQKSERMYKSKHAHIAMRGEKMNRKGYWISFDSLIKLASGVPSYDIGDDPDKLKHFRAHIPPYIIGIFQMLRESLKEVYGVHNPELYLVGGVVRDLLEKKSPKDFDITSNVDPEIMARVFEDDGWTIKEAGTDFKVLHVSKGGIDLEVARFRKDIHTQKNKTEVAPGTIYDDAARRDLTVNALYLDPFSGKVFDPSGQGLYALGLIPGSKKQIKFMGDPEKRIEEDYSRILRFFRFANKFKDMGFEVDQQSLDAVKKNFSAIQADSFDHNRIREELEKLVGLKKLEEKLEEATSRGKLLSISPDSLKPYSKNKKIKVLQDSKKVFKILTAIFRLQKMGYVPNSDTVRALRNSIEDLKSLDTDVLIAAMEKLTGIVEDIDADNLEKNFKALVDEYDELMGSERTPERERKMYELRGRSQSTFRDYFNKESSIKRYCEHCGGR